MTLNANEMNVAQRISPWDKAVSAVDGAYDPPLRGLYVAVGGTADITDNAGTTLTTVTLVAGTVWPGIVTALANISGATLYGGN